MPQSQDPKTISIDPYQTTVPLVPLQVPQAAESAPKQSALPPAYKGHAAGIATIGDSLLRGFMQGHAQKEARKYAQATAGLNVAQMTEQTAYQSYQDALAQNNGQENETTKGLYDNYKGAVQRTTDLMKQYAVPQKGGKKGASSPLTAGTEGQAKKQQDKKDGNKPQGFGEKIKDFFEANPHLVPQLAVLSREAAGVKPPGLSVEGQQNQLKLNALKRDESQAELAVNDQTVLSKYSWLKGMDPEQRKTAIAALPEEERKKVLDPQNGYDAALSRYQYAHPEKGSDFDVVKDANGNEHYVQKGSELRPGDQVVGKSQGAPQLWVDANGGLHREFMGNQQKDWTPYVNSAIAKPGTPKFYIDAYMKEHGIKSEADLTTEDLDAINQQQAKSKSPAGTENYNTRDEHGNSTTTSKKLWNTSVGARPSALGATPGKGGSPAAAAGRTAQSTDTMVVAKPKGLVEPGNLNIWNRPMVQNDDGTHSSEYSVSFADDKGREVLVPTVVNGKFLTPNGKKPKEGSPEEKEMQRKAWQHYLDTGENLGKFDNSKDADAYAKILHSRGEKKVSTSGGIMARPGSTPKVTPKAANGPLTAPPGKAAGGKQTQFDVQRSDKQKQEMTTKVSSAAEKFNGIRTTAQSNYTAAVAGKNPDYKKAGDLYGSTVWAGVKNYITALKAAGVKGSDMKDAIDAIGLEGDVYQNALKHAGVDQGESNPSSKMEAPPSGKPENKPAENKGQPKLQAGQQLMWNGKKADVAEVRQNGKGEYAYKIGGEWYLDSELQTK